MQDSINKFRIKEMKMRNLIGLALVIFVFASCKKTTEETIVYDNVIYEINDVEVYASNVQKTKQKSPEQYISIMYNDIYNQSISTTFLQDLSQLYQSVGDKTMMNELLLSIFLDDLTADVPSDTEMRNDVEQYVEDTYIRFYQRYPTAYEKQYLSNLINGDANLTSDMVFTSFVLSNEYYFY